MKHVWYNGELLNVFQSRVGGGACNGLYVYVFDIMLTMFGDAAVVI